MALLVKKIGHRNQVNWRRCCPKQKSNLPTVRCTTQPISRGGDGKRALFPHRPSKRLHTPHHRQGNARCVQIHRQLRARARPEGEIPVAGEDHQADLLAGRDGLFTWGAIRKLSAPKLAF